jgi:hypothetical protein
MRASLVAGINLLLKESSLHRITCKRERRLKVFAPLSYVFLGTKGEER